MTGSHGACPRLRGFSMIEMAVSLVVIGLMVSGSAAYLGLFRSGNQLGTDAQLVSLSESVMLFAGMRSRLPCPDTAGDGYEALVAGACPAGTQVGWLPYLSMGLSQPSARQRAIYGVYRNPAADLAVSTAPATVQTAAVQLVPNIAFVYVTGDGTTAQGAQNCAANVVSNPAFVLLASGEDLDGDGLQVDGIHNTLPANGRCFASPTRAVDTNFDDRTLAISSNALMARLTNKLL
ncbi:prepilin-type N-terminal cleavage/methylation domain-containing protein [Rhodoferax ferrireducens]|uniref:prepilin-type N-terminal cleavage/methylation domain-containing protein n=1 Tax=Rhodoferax ferrireducens TaxID=192843 RepID=UPI000E0DDF33|nr:prepilin-type N-terminal cleavage/methylation domain-containing protein [Rhodoferax ferrireducens]